MGKRRAYRSTAVKKVVLEKVLESAPVGDVHVGVDIGKGEMFTVIRWSDGTFDRPWKAVNPTEIVALVALLRLLAGNRTVTVAMESTGTYGDALRQALSDAGLGVERVSGKAAHDYAEIFDGVPSKHDGKDAAVVAELSAFGKSWAWNMYETKLDSTATTFEGPGQLHSVKSPKQPIRRSPAGGTSQAKDWSYPSRTVYHFPDRHGFWGA